mgnify:CR=1 FL=1
MRSRHAPGIAEDFGWSISVRVTRLGSVAHGDRELPEATAAPGASRRADLLRDRRRLPPVRRVLGRHRADDRDRGGGTDGAGVVALDRPLHEPAAPLGHRHGDRLHCGARLPASVAAGIRHGAASLRRAGAPRTDAGGLVYHVLNRANARAALFADEIDYRRFSELLAEERARGGMRLLAWCLMPNHWHLVLWPHADGDLGRDLLEALLGLFLGGRG